MNGTSYEKVDEFLEHYGVLGMKWGVHKGDILGTHEKASNKLRKLDSKVLKSRAKARKANEKADRKLSNATTSSKFQKANIMKAKANKKTQKANKRLNKAIKWYKSMAKTFANTDLSGIKKEDAEIGAAYAQIVFERLRY